ncbi:MAG TPA: hypothetical protein VFX61_17920 [Micromonosporaceae bacterium]|nr:hypothetical protein [Micromonosporaceae bacterium]
MGLEARLRGLKDETDGLTRRFRALAGTAPAARAGALRRRAEVHDAAAGLLDELGKLEPDRADEHRSSAEQYRAEAAADREFADLLARPLPEPGTGRSAPEPQRLADAVEQITREQA